MSRLYLCIGRHDIIGTSSKMLILRFNDSETTEKNMNFFFSNLILITHNIVVKFTISSDFFNQGQA